MVATAAVQGTICVQCKGQCVMPFDHLGRSNSQVLSRVTYSTMQCSKQVLQELAYMGGCKTFWSGFACKGKMHTFMSLWKLVEQEQGDSVLQEGVPQQLKALVGVGLLAHLGSDGLQHIHYVGHPAAEHEVFNVSVALLLHWYRRTQTIQCM